MKKKTKSIKKTSKKSKKLSYEERLILHDMQEVAIETTIDMLYYFFI